MARRSKKIDSPHNRTVVSSAPRKGSFHHGSLCEAATEVAYQIVVERGTEALNLRLVAQHCGVDHSALYRHFKDKSALKAAIIARGFSKLATFLDVRAAGDAETFLIRYAEFAVRSPRLYNLMFSEEGRELYREPQIAGSIALIMHLAAKSFDHRHIGTEIGPELRDRVFRSWALVHGLIDLWQRGLLRASTSDVALRYIANQIRQFQSGQ